MLFEEYHPFGTTSYHAWDSSAEVSAKRYRYTGKERDEETGLAYHGARYYCPWLGRWTSADPAGLVDGPNLYGYCRGDPIRGSDPSGLFAGLWTGNKARVEFCAPVGVHGRTGQLTHVVNVYRTDTGFVHASPGSPEP
ncbi:MAG: RHS repeat-associated core domain-containing protein [Polyangiaceae bacterium]|nr:RHS repeat-associated core domain-containing protein [Polyangiaceae bacterium]